MYLKLTQWSSLSLITGFWLLYSLNFNFSVFFSLLLKSWDCFQQLSNHHSWRLEFWDFQYLLDLGEHSHSCQVCFVLPLGHLPGTSTSWIGVNGLFILLLFTCPNQKSLFIFITYSTSFSLYLSKIFMLLVLSVRDMPHIHPSYHPPITALQHISQSLCKSPSLSCVKKHGANASLVNTAFSCDWDTSVA